MFSCNPINTICIYPTKNGYFAQEIARKGKGILKVVEKCTGKHNAQTAKDQFIRMGYKDVCIIPPKKA